MELVISSVKVECMHMDRQRETQPGCPTVRLAKKLIKHLDRKNAIPCLAGGIISAIVECVSTDYSSYCGQMFLKP